MKFKTNIPALLMALLVFITSNGIVLSEHICNTAHSRNYSLFTKTNCKMEQQASSCCSKRTVAKNSCCEHKQIFKKLPIEGFITNQIELKHLKKLVPVDFSIHVYSYNLKPNYDTYISGIPLPDNLFTIKYTLRPTPIVLQVFRC
jgi:hypothetical protein